MDEGVFGLVVLVFLCVANSYFFQQIMEGFILACVASALTTSIAFQLAGYFYLGFLDPFFIVSFVFSFVIAFAVSFFIGRVFFKKNNRARND